MKNALLLFVLIFIIQIAFAQQNDSSAINQFRNVNGSIYAVKENGKTKSKYYACLHLGQIRIGSEKPYIDSLLANSSSSEGKIRIYDDKRKIDYISYTVGKNKNAVGINESNLFLGFHKNKVVVIWLMSEKPDSATDNYTFSSFKIGDSISKIELLLGKPLKIKEPPNSGDIWLYDPYPFSFEIVLNKIKAIKIWKPGMKYSDCY